MLVFLQWPRIGTFCAIYDDKVIIHLIRGPEYTSSHKQYNLTDDSLLIDLKDNLVELI
jgi:hypothetical protein